jgi:hypothetical protein
MPCKLLAWTAFRRFTTEQWTGVILNRAYSLVLLAAMALVGCSTVSSDTAGSVDFEGKATGCSSSSGGSCGGKSLGDACEWTYNGQTLQGKCYNPYVDPSDFQGSCGCGTGSGSGGR